MTKIYYKIITEIKNENEIHQKVVCDASELSGLTRTLMETITNVQDYQTKEMLVKFGWTPPSEDSKSLIHDCSTCTYEEHSHHHYGVCLTCEEHSNYERKNNGN